MYNAHHDAQEGFTRRIPGTRVWTGDNSVYKVSILIRLCCIPHGPFSNPKNLGEGIIKMNKNSSDEYTILLIGE